MQNKITMKSISNERFLSEENLILLNSFLGATVTSFDIDQSQYVYCNPQNMSIEAAWPGVITLISHNGKKPILNLDFSGEKTLDKYGYEVINLRIYESKKDYSKGKGIWISWFEVNKIEIYSNLSTDILDSNTFFINPAVDFVKSHDCHELEYIDNSDEILLLHSSANQRIMLQVIESLNGSIIMHFNEAHIDKILTNKFYFYSPKKNYVKRLTLQ